MDPTQQPIDSQSLLEQGEELLDSSRRLLANLDDVLGRDVTAGPTDSDAEIPAS